MKTITFTAFDDGTFGVAHDFGNVGGADSKTTWDSAVAELIRVVGLLGREPAQSQVAA